MNCLRATFNHFSFVLQLKVTRLVLKFSSTQKQYIPISNTCFYQLSSLVQTFQNSCLIIILENRLMMSINLHFTDSDNYTNCSHLSIDIFCFQIKKLLFSSVQITFSFFFYFIHCTVICNLFVSLKSLINIGYAVVGQNLASFKNQM